MGRGGIMGQKEGVMRKKMWFGVTCLILFLVLPWTYSRGEELSKEEIIQIVITEAKERGYTIEEKEFFYYGDKGVEVYDGEKKEWTSESIDVPKGGYYPLTESNHIKVFLRPKDKGVLGGDCEIIIDKNTGEIISSIGGQ